MAQESTISSEDVSGVRAPLSAAEQGRNLFLVGFLVLFMELACIRWFAAYVIFLQFFTNVMLLACFLGMSCGCLAARGRRDWLGYFPYLGLGAVLAALATLQLYKAWDAFAIDVGHQASPQEVFFGTEYHNPDVVRFVVPMDLFVAVFFVLVALMFVGLGQVLGRAFDAYPNRVKGYTLNIGGSLAGITLFSLASFSQAPPVVWFLICCAGIAYLMHQAGSLTRGRIAALVLLLTTLAVHPLIKDHFGHHDRWSPYYAVDLNKARGSISVNTIGHQQMVPFETGGSSYSLVHLLQQHSGGAPFRDVLVIGAGSGNDLVHTLRFGAAHVDAVEIDPVIQDIGIHNHPDHPYQDPRVIKHLDDGRHFLRTTDRKYDLVIYALVDSLILHSSYANIRLESYLFTEEAFASIQRVLKPGGVFVTYNYFRQGWVVARVAAMAEKAFGCAPTVISLPYREITDEAFTKGFTVIITSCDHRIADAFGKRGPFWMNRAPPLNLSVDGFTVHPEAMPRESRDQWEKIAPTTLLHDSGTSLLTSDDWPFLYLRGKLIPDLSIRSMIVLGVLGMAMIFFFMPPSAPGSRMRINPGMFFLGAAFMLLETKAVVQLALLFGSTWLVNSLVFFTALVLILLANVYVLKVPGVRRTWHYAALFLVLGANILIPVDTFLDGNMLWRYAVPCLLALGPMFFAGVIFALSFREVSDPDRAFGSNIAGAVVGGLAESFSMLLGFRYLLLLAILFYALSALPLKMRPRRINSQLPSAS